MKTLSASLLSVASLLILSPALHGQALYTATKSTQLEVGVGATLLRPDYVEVNNYGVTIFADLEFYKFKGVGIGIDGELKFDGIISPDDIGEDSYLIGPKFTFYHRHKLGVYGKILLGRGIISNQDTNTSSGYNTFAYGGGVEYRIRPKFNVRGDVELQQWPNFFPHTLSPIAATIGVAYIIK